MLRLVFGSLGVPEILFILVLALLIFGPRRLPEIGKTLGKAMGEFRRATSDLKSSIEREVNLENQPPPARRAPAKPASTSVEPPLEAPEVKVESLEVETEALPPSIEKPMEGPIPPPSKDQPSSPES